MNKPSLLSYFQRIAQLPTMSAKRREKGYSETLYISDRQKSSLAQKNIIVRKEKVFKDEIIDLERAKFERQLNQEAKTLMKSLKLPKLAVRSVSENRSVPSSPQLSRQNHFSNQEALFPRSQTPCRGSTHDLAGPFTTNKPGNIIETIVSPPSQPSLPIQARKNLDNDRHTLGLQGNASPRKGSMNDISLMDRLMFPPSPSPRRGSLNDITKINKAMNLLVSPSPASWRRGSLVNDIAQMPTPNSPSLQQRRNTFTSLSPLSDKPISPLTKNLAMRQLVRQSSGLEESQLPEPPKPASLEEQFKQLESCRYLRKRGSQEEEEEDIKSVFVTKPDTQ